MIKITTGDNKEFELYVKQSDNSISYEFNNTVYELINKDKSFVDRRNVKSRVLSVIGYFQGEQHNEQTEMFRISSLDKNYWTLNHPIYGVIYGHPLKVNFTNSDLNTTLVEVDFWETIIDAKGVTTDVSTNERLSNLYDSLTDNAVNAYEVEDKKELLSNLNSVKDSYQSLYYNNIEGFLERYQEVSKSIDNVVSHPEGYVKDIYAFVDLGASVKTNVFLKLNTIAGLFDIVLSNNNTTLKYKEISGASVIGTMSQSIIDLDTNLLTRQELLQLNETLVNAYNEYFLTLEQQGAELDYELQSSLYSMVCIAVYNLFNLIYDARQEREYICEEDTNIILLTFKFMGIATDENLRFFKKVNNINTEELFLIKKDRVIKYYV